MANKSLLLSRQLCNEVYYVTFKIDSVAIFNHEGNAILKEHRDLGTELRRVNLRKDKTQIQISAANNIYELRNKGFLINYLHKAMFSPAKSAFLKAVKQGHLTTWPGLTEDTINKHLKMTPATAMGRMNHKKTKHPLNQKNNAGHI
jgi:hypothetical protein